MQGGRETLVLWDLDRTLLDVAGVDREVWFELCSEIVGRPVADAEVIEGSTIRGLLRSILQQFDVSEAGVDELLPRAMAREVELLRERRGLLVQRGRALPGAKSAIERFSQYSHIFQSALTGNQIEVAEMKLEAYGLLEGLDLQQGAFGKDTVDRPDLVPIAIAKAERRLGRRVDPADVLLIGDTVLDVEAARRNGARVVGVSTGTADAGSLSAAGADLVVSSLDDLCDAIRNTPTLNGIL